MTRGAARAAVGLVGALVGGAARAQDGGRHAAVVLALPASARAAALGDAYVGVGGDDAALFYDPAQLATVRAAAGVSVERYLASSIVAAFSAAARVGPGSVGVGVQSIRYDGIDEIVGGETTGRVLSAGDAVASVGYGADLGALGLPGVARFRLGGAVKYARQRVAEASGGAVAGDASLAAELRGGAVLALVMQNVGGEIDLLGIRSPLPRRARLGAALPIATSRRLTLLGTAAATHVAHGRPRVAAGAEARWHPSGRPAGRGADPRALALDIRLGVRPRTAGAAGSPVTVGGGIGAGALALDYAYQGYSVLGSTHRLGARWSR